MFNQKGLISNGILALAIIVIGIVAIFYFDSNRTGDDAVTTKSIGRKTIKLNYTKQDVELTVLSICKKLDGEINKIGNCDISKSLILNDFISTKVCNTLGANVVNGQCDNLSINGNIISKNLNKSVLIDIENINKKLNDIGKNSESYQSLKIDLLKNKSQIADFNFKINSLKRELKSIKDNLSNLLSNQNKQIKIIKNNEKEIKTLQQNSITLVLKNKKKKIAKTKTLIRTLDKKCDKDSSLSVYEFGSYKKYFCIKN